MSLVVGLIFAHLRPTLGAIDLREYNMKSCTVLVFLLAEICFSCFHAVEGTKFQPNYEVEHLEQKKTHLSHIHDIYVQLENLGYIDPALGVAKYETMERAALGSLLSVMNYECIPKHLVHLTDKVVEKIDQDGSFSVFIAVNSLADGNKYYHFEGDIDIDTLKLNIKYRKELSRKEFQEVKETAPASVLHTLYQKVGNGSSSFNNGSKGETDLLFNIYESGEV